METNNPVEWTVEENFKFRLSKMTDKLLEWASQPDGMRYQLYCVLLLCDCCSSHCPQDSKRAGGILDQSGPQGSLNFATIFSSPLGHTHSIR